VKDSPPVAQEPLHSSRRVHFVSLGCPKNRVDTEVMLGKVDSAGLEIVPDAAAADVIVVNTCGFIDEAKEESIDTILEMAEHKTAGNCEKLVVTGCLTQRYPDELAREIPEIDHILGSADYADIARIVGHPVREGAPAARRKLLPVVQVSDTPAYLYDHTEPRLLGGPRHSVYVKIAEGCDRPCSFCIIPKLRGPQRSRSEDSVVREIEGLAAAGAREINLVAQDLTRYGADLPAPKPTLASLLRKVARVPGVRWVRLHYTYPSAFTDELIEVIADEPTVLSYVDVPLQHIDGDMLKRMRRGHSPRVIRKLIDTLRERIDDVVIRTTFIVGHPGETDEAFASLRAFVQASEFDRVGVFTYSSEHGTHSATLADAVDPKLAEARRAELMELQRHISRRKQQALVGSELEVMVDGPCEETDLLVQGRWFGQAPEIDGHVVLTDGAAPAGAILRARVSDAADYDLVASIL
jgi:ribosomal protein S12 methylthiotransferase